MPLSAFGKSRWFGDDEEQDGPTPLFPPGVIGTDKQSMFPVKSDESPVLSGLKAGWKGLGDWLQAPADSSAGSGGDLLGYKPTSHISAIGDALTGAAKGVMGARGPYSNWLGSGLLGATEGLESSRAKDLQLRKLSQEQQYKNAGLALKRIQAEHAGDYTIGRTRFGRDNKPLVTAPPEEMSEADKARIANEDRRIELEGRRADQTDAYQRAQLAQGAAGQAETAGYHKTEAELARQRLDVERQNAGTPKTEDERRDKRMLDYSAAVAAGKTPTAEQVAQHERDYREAGEPKETVDPVTGVRTTVQPDVSDLPRPPSMAAQPAPAPGVTQTPELFPRAQMEESGKKYTAFRGLTDTVAEMKAKLAKMSASERFSSDDATQLGVMKNSIISAIAAAENAGVVQQGESGRFEATLGPLTGGWAAANKITGLDRVNSALDAVLGTSRTSLNASAPDVSGAEGAKKMQLGTPFRLNGHLVVKHGPDDYAVIE
jgi:hypothetical protein